MKEGASIGGKRAPPEFMSTHPSHDRRISQFDEWMPEAMHEFEEDFGDRCNRVRHEMATARRHAAQEASRREASPNRKQPRSHF
eukprot:CAMPEP_0116845614 /NCGR_PEP_ID=MMETSP0418-20121206/13368_1 /TAXON_ID=1158023 /ORGANISM="Astrosyne radiata, Strain 13vi08-1A" /LENGTH=83 /DNA_ID=CAMNT_0004476751 /DNA_START=106 /DNA_END=357 /DNA_ORIENTATION=-